MTTPSASGDSAGLRGSQYLRNNQLKATRDGDVSGRWVAVDESGWDGEQLYGRDDRFLVLGSVAVDDDGAVSIVEALRRDAKLVQPPELKFNQFTTSGRVDRLGVLADFFKPGGALGGLASIYLVDKHYFVTGKIIDLLLEERANTLGLNLHAGGLARELARTLFNEGPRALGRDNFNRLMSTMVCFASRRNRDGSQVSVDTLFDEIDKSWARSNRRSVSSILYRLRETRCEAISYLKVLSDFDHMQAMEPLIPSLGSIIHVWSAKLGRMSVLIDEQRVLTDSVLDATRKIATFELGPLGRFIHVPRERAVLAVVRGVSRDHPSIQLADIVAGAGQAVARRHAGKVSPSGEQLWPVIVPLITDRSMVPHDEPGRFARPNAI